MPFIHDDFLLTNEPAKKLYHGFAKDQPIWDYHNHLVPKDLADNRVYDNLAAIWLEGDHYKWRAMRANGIEESLITGDADPKDKFLAWAQTVPKTLRNPLHHWTALELKRVFDIDTPLNPETAESIWEQANEQLQTPERSTHGLLKLFNVQLVCTTDDPTDDLLHHQRLQLPGNGLQTRVLPTFRPDPVLNTQDPQAWQAWVKKLETAAGANIESLENLLDALDQRHAFFHAIGGRLSDRGLTTVPTVIASQQAASQSCLALLKGQALAAADAQALAGFLLHELGKLDAKRGWVTQMHIGPLRNNNGRILQTIGRDAGCDSMGDARHAEGLACYLDGLDRIGHLPKTVLYNINPSDNHTFATMAGNYQQAPTAGKIQFGSGWWFLDQIRGMQSQINTLSDMGLLAHFIGMLTDSRSMMSFPRHEYFRRVLCNLLGQDMVDGVLPNDEAEVGQMVTDICSRNVQRYLALDA